MPAEVTDALVAELRRLRAAGSPGTWDASGPSPPDAVPVTAFAGGMVARRPVAMVCHDLPGRKGRRRLCVTRRELDDAVLIAAAVNALLPLLDEIDRLRAELFGGVAGGRSDENRPAAPAVA